MAKQDNEVSLDEHAIVRAHLTVADIRKALDVAHEMAATPDGPTAAVAFAFLMHVLPTYKGIASAGQPHARMSRAEWQKLSGGPRYAPLRDASGLFTKAGGYNPHEAKAKDWRCSFEFEQSTPARAVLGLRSKRSTEVYKAAKELTAGLARPRKP